MPIRPFRPEDAPTLAELAVSCARGETDFVLSPLWESADELFAEFERHRIDPADHLRVAEVGDGSVAGCVGFVRAPDASVAGLVCPVVERAERGRGLGGELLRDALSWGRDELGIRIVSAAIGARNRAGYSLLSAMSFRAARQHYLMRLDAPPKSAPPAGVEIGPASPDDAEGILAIYRACNFDARDLDTMSRLMADEHTGHVVARRAGELVGFAEIETFWPKRPWVAFVGVAPAVRDQGLGTALVASALEQPFASGASAALLLLSPGNRTAVRAYEKVGFRRHRLVDVLDRGL